jgi:hypothetical protein
MLVSSVYIQEHCEQKLKLRLYVKKNAGDRTIGKSRTEVKGMGLSGNYMCKSECLKKKLHDR